MREAGVSGSECVGVFDSGVGGLSVLGEIRRELPGIGLQYVADSRHAPYGDKPREYVEARSLAICDFLLERGCEAIVVACNTATGAAIETLRGRYRVPIVGMEPAVKPAAERTRSGVVGVLATGSTLSSPKFATLRARFPESPRILVQPCPGLVDQVEAGDLQGPITRALLAHYLAPLLREGADVIVLGCTHYPFLAPLIWDLVPPGVQIIDPSPAVSRELRRRLQLIGAKALHRSVAKAEFWTSGSAERVAPVLAQLWGAAVELRSLPASAA